LLNDAVSTLHPTAMLATLSAIGATSAKYTARWTLDAHHTWSYSGTFGLVRTAGDWRVHWTPAVLYPTLRDGQRLALVTVAADHTAVVDRVGKTLVTAGAAGRRLADKDFQPMLTALVARVPSGPSTTFGIERVDANGRNLQTLYGSATGTAKPLKSTLSASVQSAALSVVDSYSGDATIVAISPSDGGLLAAAQNGTDQPSPFVSLYAPGSTFKIVTATAALEAGIATENSELPCPRSEVIGTRKISNDEGFDLGTTTMRLAFAHSCNTTFGKLASQVPPAELVDVADQFGLNADFEIPGLDTQTGKVVPSADADQQVEDGIGQGNEQVSPFGEALMAATVAAGHAVTPQLWRDDETSVATAYSAPPDSVLTPLRGMMRAVVTTGTATGLAHSGTVYGKTGTAQVADPKDANGWFTGYRGDIAFAVFLPNSNGSGPAVELAAKFLAALG
ncbi:MAG TPA: penicillin-binding transpeptidase domain-containing protein, partial [Pseudonocardiaceae bacterium]|nr:penicillin-binding transpeptidase domain-containing protein [Pseudonocardiaceae bacterium]